ncbi:MAG: hypothetical protein PHQ20_02550 [Candidatus Moranbacteria bacterium]|jgi:hypothetical protein|nr:hypothetical protein [Candidatus Moranbacteria bacterium]
MDNKKLLLIFSFVSVVFFVSGFMIASVMNINKDNSVLNGNKDQSTNNNNQETNYSNPADFEIRSISGKIKDIQDQKIIIETLSLEDPMGTELEDRTVIINGDTKFYRSQEKTPEAYKREIEEFNAKLSAEKENSSLEAVFPPDPFIKTEINLTELKKDQQVSILSGENIKGKQAFTAIEVYLQMDLVDNTVQAVPSEQPAPIEQTETIEPTTVTEPVNDLPEAN